MQSDPVDTAERAGRGLIHPDSAPFTHNIYLPTTTTTTTTTAKTKSHVRIERRPMFACVLQRCVASTVLELKPFVKFTEGADSVREI